MEFTGERHLGTSTNAQISYEHWHRYLFAINFVKNKRVLDIACGEGYGAHLLADYAEEVIGIDISKQAIDHAKENYKKNNLVFLIGSANKIPLSSNNSFDIIISYETIEHIDNKDQKLFLQEVKRLLKKDGLFLVSTPDKYYYSDLTNYKNEYHIKEFYRDEFEIFLKEYFMEVAILGQQVFTGSTILYSEDSNKHNLVPYYLKFDNKRFVQDEGGDESTYLFAICSNGNVPVLNSVLLDKSMRLLKEKDELWSLEIDILNRNFSGNMANLFIIKEDDSIISKKVELGDKKFNLLFNLDGITGIKYLRFDPTENRVCRIKINSLRYRTKNNSFIDYPISELTSNGQLDPDGFFSFETIDPMIFIKLEGVIYEVEIEGEREELFHIEELIGEKNSVILQKNIELTTKETALSAKVSELTHTKEQLAEKETALFAKISELTHTKEQLVEKETALSAKISELTRTKEQLAEKETALSAKISELTRTKEQLVEKETELTQKLNELNRVFASLSWRITKPFRFGSEIIRKFFKLRYYFVDILRKLYVKLPLPYFIRRFARRIFKGYTNRQNENSFNINIDKDGLGVGFKPDVGQLDKPDYIIWSVIDWHFRHQRPQQLAESICKKGRRVFYVSVDMIDSENSGFNVEKLGDSNTLFQVKLFAKGAPVIYHGAPTQEIIKQLHGSIGKFLRWSGSISIINLVNHPFWLDIANTLPNSILCYDCMDLHEGFGNNDSSLSDLETRLFNESELTVTTSLWLDNHIKDKVNRKVLIRNAADYEHFSTQPSKVYKDAKGRRIIGYYGAIAEWFDLDLVEKIAIQHPEFCILLIGNDTVNAKAKLSKRPNIVFTGEVSYNDLPYYLFSFDICILPFMVIPLTLATNPVKIYEYLSAGKPIVSIDLPEMKQFKNIVFTAKGHEEFLSTLNTLTTKKENKQLIQDRRSFAKNQTWKHRADILISNCEKNIDEPVVSVIVVTYNNLNFSKACLTSLDKYSLYSNLEIIVVDNASKDGTQEFLKTWVVENQTRKIILNDENKGFAAANNQGLDIASGEFFILLNNDTYVTPGWVRTMLNHLKRDKEVGIIGPVTNNIGNEAKIDINYSNMEEMIAQSHKYTSTHIGQSFSIRTLAFFCVMFPRTTYNKIGKLDEAFGQGFFEDDDYCRRVEQVGLKIQCAEDVFIHHHLSASFNKLKQNERLVLFEKNKEIYEKKWGEWIAHKYRD